MRAATDQYDASGLFVDETDVPPRWMCRCTVCGSTFESNADDPVDICDACESTRVCDVCGVHGSIVLGVCTHCASQGRGIAWGGG